jgi:hypothetical protein
MNLRLFALLLSITLSACALINPCGSTKEDYISAWEQLLEDAKKEGKKEKPEWTGLDARYEQLYEKCRIEWEDELSVSETVKIGTIIAQYQGQKLMNTKIKDIF